MKCKYFFLKLSNYFIFIYFFRYNLESKRLFRVISEHKVRNSSLEINEEPKSRWNHVETYLKTEDIINMAPAGTYFNNKQGGRKMQYA